MRGARAAFWGSTATVAFTYVGFPVLLGLRAALRPRPWIPVDPSPPSVTVVIAAHNEAAAIADKIRNVLALDHPAPVDCVVVSDGSTDDTVARAESVGDPRSTVVDLPRSGKATALNHGVSVASGEVLVFTDANSMLAPDALRELLAPFADPDVGGVAGDQQYLGEDGAAAGERAYWDLDRLLKVAESRGGNVISATGALYAVRRELAQPVPDGVTDDFAMSTGVIEQGRRLVFAPGAVAFEPPAEALGGEYRRKVRVMTRGLRGVALRRSLLDPRRSGFYALQLLAHKVLRRLSVLPLAVGLLSALRLRRAGPLYGAAAAAGSAAAGASVAAVALSRTRLRHRRWVAVPAYVAMANAAAAHALWNVLTGRRIDLWTPQRGGEG